MWENEVSGILCYYHKSISITPQPRSSAGKCPNHQFQSDKEYAIIKNTIENLELANECQVVIYFLADGYTRQSSRGGGIASSTSREYLVLQYNNVVHVPETPDSREKPCAMN